MRVSAKTSARRQRLPFLLKNTETSAEENGNSRNKANRSTRNPTAAAADSERRLGAGGVRGGRFRHIGRGEDFQVRCEHQLVSRRHAQGLFENGGWRLRDLQRTNGTYGEGTRIDQIPLRETTLFTLGRNGPEVTATVQEPAPATSVLDPDLLSQYEDYYLKQSPGGNAGERTIFIRQAFKDLQRKQRRRNAVLVALASTLVVVLASYG